MDELLLSKAEVTDVKQLQIIMDQKADLASLDEVVAMTQQRADKSELELLK